MNTNKVDNKMIFSSIFDMVNQRQIILHELYQLQHQESKLQDKLKELDKPFKTNTINVEYYKKFFNYYYLENKITGTKYIVNEIIKDFDNVENIPFWSVKYTYIDSNNVQNDSGPLSLRKFLHIIDDGFIFKEKEKSLN